nr:protein MEMO1-like [Equus asinus]
MSLEHLVVSKSKKVPQKIHNDEGQAATPGTQTRVFRPWGSRRGSHLPASPPRTLSLPPLPPPLPSHPPPPYPGSRCLAAPGAAPATAATSRFILLHQKSNRAIGRYTVAAGPRLNAQLEGWLSQGRSTKSRWSHYHSRCRITSCGFCCCRCLWPSHPVPLSRCALCSVDSHKIPPFGLLLIKRLWSTEDEHTIDTHWPCTVKAIASPKDGFTIISLLIGTQNESKEQEFEKLCSKYLVQHRLMEI